MNDVVTQVLGIGGSSAIAALVAIGLSVVFRLTGVINMAHGSFIMIGAYTAVLAQQDLNASWPEALALAIVVGLILGILIEVFVIRHLYHSPELSILATFGLALVLQQLVAVIIGKQYEQFASPLPNAVAVLGVQYPAYDVLLLAGAVILIGIVLALLRFTPLDVRVRAVAGDRGLAESVGIRATWLNLGVFAVGVALATLVGVLVAPISTISPTMGQNYLFTAFVVVIVSGRRMAGIIHGAIAFGIVQNLVSVWANPVLAQLAVLVLALAALLWQRRASMVAAV